MKRQDPKPSSSHDDDARAEPAEAEAAERDPDAPGADATEDEAPDADTDAAAPEAAASEKPPGARKAARARAEARRAKRLRQAEATQPEARKRASAAAGDEDFEGTPRAAPEVEGVRGSFARGYPKDTALAALLDAFDRGDFGAVRTGAAELARSAKSAAVRKAATDLRQRTAPAPVATFLIVLALGLMLLLFVYYLTSPP